MRLSCGPTISSISGVAGHKSSRKVRRHSELCFQRAFPRSVSEYRAAIDELAEFTADVPDSGIAGAPVFYRFSFDVASWLARKVPGAVSIDWSELHDTEPLDDLLRCVLQPSEDEYFDSGYASTREWIDVARSGSRGTDFDWLMAQLQDTRFAAFYRQLYDAADLPLAWALGESPYSRTRNVFSSTEMQIRSDGMRRRPPHAKKEIARPVENVSRLSAQRGSELLDVAVASLAARHRETYHFSFADPEEVYVADVGKGIEIAVFGLLPEHRFPLECTLGYLILSNGVPIGYGGSSVLFKQVNTGINIFDEYRRSEAAYLWVQVMRVYHSLVGCTRYVANPYQLGSGNREALRSGAFWFYYRLGYRPVDPVIRRLALDEQSKMRRKPDHRSDLRTLARLSACDMHLTLPTAKQSEFFDEAWLATSSGLATRALAEVAGRTRNTAANKVARLVAKQTGIRSLQSWTPNERRGLIACSPFVAAVNPAAWSIQEKRHIRRLLRAKGGKRELDYAQLLATSDCFLQALREACIREDKSL